MVYHCWKQAGQTFHLTPCDCLYIFTSSHCAHHCNQCCIFLEVTLPCDNPNSTSISTLPPAWATYTDLGDGGFIANTIGFFNYSESSWKTSINRDQILLVCWKRSKGANVANNWVMTCVQGVDTAKLWSRPQVNVSNATKCTAKEQGCSLC